MPRPRFALSAPQKEIIDIFAHVIVLSDISKNVKGAEGLLDYHLKTTMTPRQQSIWQALQDRAKQVQKDMAKMLKQEQETDRA